MNILVICETFSKTGPTSMCLKSVVDEAVNRGHQCRVVSSNGIVFNSKISLEYKNSCDLVKEDFDRSILAQLKKYITPFLRYYTWPDEPFSNLDCFYNTVLHEIDNDRPDIVVCSVGSVNSVCVGNKIKDNCSDIKFVPYYLDSILGGAKLRIMPHFLHIHKALKWEEKYLYNADSIVMMKYVEKKYRSLTSPPSYFNKIKFLDLPLYKPENKLVSNCKKYFSPDENVVFFAGTMPNNIRDPRFILSVFQKVQIPNINLYIAGTSDYEAVLEEYSEKNSRIHLLGVISHEMVIEMMKEADVLLSIGNNLDCMIPCKIFEYMSTGKPILATYKRKTDPSIEYFGYYKKSLLLDEKMEPEAAARQVELFLDMNYESHENIIIDSLYKNTPLAFWVNLESIM